MVFLIIAATASAVALEYSAMIKPKTIKAPTVPIANALKSHEVTNIAQNTIKLNTLTCGLFIKVKNLEAPLPNL
jgi:hypothetical protein